MKKLNLKHKLWYKSIYFQYITIFGWKVFLSACYKSTVPLRSKCEVPEKCVTTGMVQLPLRTSFWIPVSAQADLPEVPPGSQREATRTVHHRRAFICQTVLTLTHAGFPTTSFSRQRFFGLTCATKCESAKRNLNKCHVCLSGCPFSAPWASLEETLPGLRSQRPQSVPPEHRGYPSCCLFLPLCTTDDRHSFLLWNMWLNFYSAFST